MKDFVNNHPYLTVLLALVALGTVSRIVYTIVVVKAAKDLTEEGQKSN